MSDTAEKTVVKSGSMTKKSDKVGIDVLVCAPNWFDEKKQYKIANAPKRTASLAPTFALTPGHRMRV